MTHVSPRLCRTPALLFPKGTPPSSIIRPRWEELCKSPLRAMSLHLVIGPRGQGLRGTASDLHADAFGPAPCQMCWLVPVDKGYCQRESSMPKSSKPATTSLSIPLLAHLMSRAMSECNEGVTRCCNRAFLPFSLQNLPNSQARPFSHMSRAGTACSPGILLLLGMEEPCKYHKTPTLRRHEEEGARLHEVCEVCM